jgi:histidinol-phosphatase (PHP family)
MIQRFSHHCHTLFSDGKTTPEAFLVKAKEEKMLSLGFSDHAPIPPTDLTGIRIENLQNYLEEIERLKQQTGEDLQIYKGLEVDYIPGLICVNSGHIVNADLDYTLGAVHYVDHFNDGSHWGYESSHERFQKGVNEIFHGDVQAAVSRYYELIREMVRDHRPDIVAHLDRIKKLNTGSCYFDEQDKWYQEEVLATLELIAQQDCILEVNTKGYYKGECEDTYPGKWVLREANSLGISVHLASDAHHPEFLNGAFEHAAYQLKSIDYRSTKVLFDHAWQDCSLIEKRIHVC